jgi:non-homologous end joining protein Ku
MEVFMEKKAIRNTKVFFGSFSFPVKIMHFADRLGLPPEVEVCPRCLSEFEKQIFCPACKKQIEKFIPVSLSTNVCPECHKKADEPEIKFFCQVCQAELAREGLNPKKVYLLGEKKVELTDNEKKKLEEVLPATKDIEVITFLLANSFEPYFGETCYALVPENSGEIAYVYFREALEKMNAVALANVFILKRYYRAIIQPKGNLLFLWTMYYEDEIDFPKILEVEINPDLFNLMLRIIGSSLSDFQAKKHLRNDYLKMFYSLVAAKEAKGEIPEVVRQALPLETANLTKELEETFAAILGEQNKNSSDKKNRKNKKNKE